jgi:site-specific recombinase XerC
MFRALAADDIVPANPAREVQAPRGLDRLAEHHRAVSPAQLLRVLKNIPDDARGRRDRAIILLMANNGLRRAEVSALRLSDLRLDEEPPSVRIRGKGLRVDVQPLKDGTTAALRAWLEVRDVRAGEEPDSPVFHSLARGSRKRGLKRLSGGGIYRALRRYFPGRSPHGLRALCLTQTWLRSDGNIDAARIVGRHSSASTTQKYIRADTVSAAAAYAPDYS